MSESPARTKNAEAAAAAAGGQMAQAARTAAAGGRLDFDFQTAGQLALGMVAVIAAVMRTMRLMTGLCCIGEVYNYNSPTSYTRVMGGCNCFRTRTRIRILPWENRLLCF